MQGGLGLSRWWGLVLAPLALALMLFGATPADEAVAQAAPTATPTFVWLVPHNDRASCGNNLAQNDHCIHIDPIERQFVYYPDKRTPNAPTVAAKVRSMEVTQQRVTWKWNDPSRTTFIWGNVDRVRKTVRVTLWKRERSGVAQSHLFSSGTPRTLPVAQDPRIVIQDNKFIPNRLVISRGQQVNFQNKMRVPVAIRFTTGGPGGVEPSNPSWIFREDFCSVLPRCEIPAGRIAPPFPIRPANPPTPLPDANPPVFWRLGTHTFVADGQPLIKQGTIQVRDN